MVDELHHSMLLEPWKPRSDDPDEQHDRIAKNQLVDEFSNHKNVFGSSFAYHGKTFAQIVNLNFFSLKRLFDMIVPLLA